MGLNATFSMRLADGTATSLVTTIATSRNAYVVDEHGSDQLIGPASLSNPIRAQFIRDSQGADLQAALKPATQFTEA